MAVTSRADEQQQAQAAMRPTVSPPAIETVDLRKVYGDFVALEGLSLTVGQGEVFGFLGPNGAGKSTTVKILTGLTRPTSGSARLLGRPLGDKDARRRLGYLPELFRFHDWQTAWEFLDTHGKLYRMPSRERQRRISEVLEMVGLLDRRDDRLRTFSKGMQQRAGIAQALLHDPALVFLDEPTSALDPIGRRVVRDLITQLREMGTTVLLNSHLLSEVEMVCDRVAIINRGKLIASGPLQELLQGSLTVTLRVGNWSDAVRDIAAGYRTLEGPRIDGAGTGTFTVELTGDDEVPMLVQRLIGAGADIYEVSPHRQHLEDLFVGLVDQSDGLDFRR